MAKRYLLSTSPSTPSFHSIEGFNFNSNDSYISGSPRKSGVRFQVTVWPRLSQYSAITANNMVDNTGDEMAASSRVELLVHQHP